MSSGRIQRGSRAAIQVSSRFSGLASRKLGSRVASTDRSSLVSVTAQCPSPGPVILRIPEGVLTNTCQLWKAK